MRKMPNAANMYHHIFVIDQTTIMEIVRQSRQGEAAVEALGEQDLEMAIAAMEDLMEVQEILSEDITAEEVARDVGSIIDLMRQELV